MKETTHTTLDAAPPSSRFIPALSDLQPRLAAFNQQRLLPAYSAGSWEKDLAREMEYRTLEGHFVEEERKMIAPRAAAAPTEATAFVTWFEELRARGPGQGDALFPWLVNHANFAQMHWFLTQELAGEAGFDDLVAMTQVKFPVQAKLELARNYWDEMGRGRQRGMHGLMLEGLAEELNLKPTLENTVWEALALANMMVALAANRRYAYHAIGALGVVEMTAPGRVAQVNAGLKRLGVAAKGRRYFQLHAGLDIQHSKAWNIEILHSLVESNPRVAPAIAEGALLRLACGARCFARYREMLQVSSEPGNERLNISASSETPRHPIMKTSVVHG